MQDKSVEVNNFDVLRLGLRKELDRVKRKLDESAKSRGGINLALDVNGLQELMEMIYKLMDILVTIDYAPTINIPAIEIPEIKLPEIRIPEMKTPNVYVPEPVVNVAPANVNIDVSGVIQALDNLKYLSDRANKPLAVRMSDGKKFVQAIQNLEKATEQLGVVYAGSSGLTTDDLKFYSGRFATDVIYGDQGARLTPKFAKISAGSSGDNTIVAAVSGKKIRVLQMDMISSGTVNGKFQDGAGGTDLTGLAYMIANTGLVRPFSAYGWFETSAGTLLNLNLSGATTVGGSLLYIEV